MKTLLNAVMLSLACSISFSQSQTQQQSSPSSSSMPQNQSISIAQQNYDYRTQSMLKNLYSGRPTLTGQPTFRGGAKFSSGVTFSNTSGNALTFQDGTTQNTAGLTLSAGRLTPGLMVLVSSGVFTAVSSATVILPSTSTYKNFLIIADLKNVNAADQTMIVAVGTDTSADYSYAGGAAASNASNNGFGCPHPAGPPSMTQDAANATNWGKSEWAQVKMNFDIVANNEAVATWDNYTMVDVITSIAVRSSGGFDYGGSSLGSLGFCAGTTSSCASRVCSANSITGTIYVFALPF